MRAIPQLVSAPLNPIPIAEHFRRSHPPREHSRGQHILVRKITQSKTKTVLNKLKVHTFETAILGNVSSYNLNLVSLLFQGVKGEMGPPGPAGIQGLQVSKDYCRYYLQAQTRSTDNS